MRGGILIVVSAIQGVVGYFTRKIREIFRGKPYVIKYEYDANNRMTKVTNDGDEVIYEYDEGGRLTKVTLPNGITCDYSYNSNGQVTQMLYMNGASTVCDIQYKYGKGGNRIQKSIEIPPNPAVVEDYNYDANYRLVQVMKDGALFRSYTYDAMGNRLSKRTASDTISCGYDACDQMNYAGELSYRYDLKGRLTASYSPDDDAERTYVWDYADRLRYINYPDGTKSEMRYDSEGKRTYRKDKDGVVTNYYWSPSGIGNVINETDGAGTAKASYILGPDLIVIKVSGAKKYYIKDALGSVIALTDASGNVTDTYEYNDFGELISSTGSSYNSYLYTGQQFDADSEMYYLRARYYEPGIGRFISRDVIGLNYQYVQNNPTDFLDPSGLILVMGNGFPNQECQKKVQAAICILEANKKIFNRSGDVQWFLMHNELTIGWQELYFHIESPKCTVSVGAAMAPAGIHGKGTSENWGGDVTVNPDSFNVSYKACKELGEFSAVMHVSKMQARKMKKAESRAGYESGGGLWALVSASR